MKGFPTAVALLLASLFLVGLFCVGLQTRDQVRAKTTTTRMRMLMAVLRSQQPEHFDPTSLRPRRGEVPSFRRLQDGWVRDLLVERDPAALPNADEYRVISLGVDLSTPTMKYSR
jgi:hypothetical protein